MTRLRLAALILALFALTPAPAAGQVSIPFSNFVSGQVIASGESNANFAILADQVLDRTGGTLTGHLIVNTGITIDGVDISTYFGAGGEVLTGTKGSNSIPALAPSDDTDTGLYYPAADQIAMTLGGTARLVLDSGGLTVYSNTIFNSSGKIPAISSSYFGSLDGGALHFSEDSIADGTILARLASNDVIAADWAFTGGLAITPAWASSGTVFRGLDLNVTNTNSAAGSKLIDLRVGDLSVASVSPAGNFVAPAIQITNAPIAGAVLVSNASGVGTWTDLSNAIPQGMLAFFETACPAGWTRRDTYDNKFLRGGASYTGTGGGSDVAHAHTYDPPNTATTTAGSHTHTVDFASATSTSAGSHTHEWGGSLQVPEAGAHTHDVSINTSTSGGGGDIGLEFAGGSGTAGTNHTHSLSASTTSSSSGAHTHFASYPLTDTQGSHTHTVDLGASSTSSDGSHAHAVDIAAGTTSSVSAVPAYIQVVVCKKD